MHEATLEIGSQHHAFSSERHRFLERGRMFSHEIIQEIVPFLQRQVKVKPALNEHPYHILNFGSVSHI